MANIRVPVKITLTGCNFAIDIIKDILSSIEFDEEASPDYKEGFTDLGNAVINALTAMKKERAEISASKTEAIALKKLPIKAQYISDPPSAKLMQAAIEIYGFDNIDGLHTVDIINKIHEYEIKKFFRANRK